MRHTNDSSLARAQREISFQITLSIFFLLLAAIKLFNMFFALIKSPIDFI